ncbi:MAG: hypothetical protein GY773_15555 [Actinomycetia bacterium]|nr:hypothetical protein [Actinomycetes bacterium]
MFVLFAMATFPGGAGLKEELDELKREQEELQKDKEDKAKDVDLATAEADDLSAALELLNADVNEQATKVAAAERALVAAQTRHDTAIEAVVGQASAINDLEGRLSERAISSFVNQEAGRSPMLEEVDPNKAVRMQSLVEAVTDDGISVTDELRAAKEDLEIEQRAADDAAAEAERIQIRLIEDLAELERRQMAQADLVIAAEEKLERNLAEAWALSELDKELSAEIGKKNDQLAAQLAVSTRSNNPAPSSGGNPSFPSASQIVNVKGIWVHTDIADNLRRMLDAAEAAGHNFSGGGYRDSQSQIRLRRAHCGTSEYAIWRMPSSQCRPPTARPGASQHEQGKAIDFRYNGSIIGSRSSAGFKWLSANAASYGFFNLPSEPWHWSVNGR